MDVPPGSSRRRPYPQLSARRPWIVLIVLLLVAGAVWGAWMLAHNAGHGGRGPFGRGGRRPPTTVGMVAAARADVPVTLDALGTVTPIATVTVRPQVSGVITQILFKEGQMVRRGQPLAIIDPRPLRMALLQSEGQLARDQAQLLNARLTLGRYRTLLAQDSIARQDVDTQAATVKQLEGAVTTDRAAVGTARLNLGYSRVTAPIGGRVGLRAIDVGNYISAGDANGLVVLTEVAPTDVEFTVPQDETPRIMRRAAQAALPVTALDRAGAGVLAQGTFSTLDNQVDPTTGTVRAKARFANANGALFPNQFVNVRLQVDTLRNVIVVPVTAVRTGPDGDFVWVVRADQTVTMRPVKRGQTTATQVVILSGLSPGDKVVTEGGDRLTEGGRVLLPGQIPSFPTGGRGGRGGGRAGFGRSGAGGGGQGAGSGGGFTPSPQMQAARAALRQACGADIQRLCPGQTGREAFMCLRENADKASAACRDALSKLPMRRPGFGGPAPGATSGGGAPAEGG